MTNLEFEQELTREKPLLFSFSMKLTRNYQDAQDLFQDGAARGFRYCFRFESGTNFRAWMSTIIRHTFINNFRARQRKRTVNEPIETFLFSIKNENIVANQGEMNMRIQEIYSMLDELKDLYSIPFILHFKGYEYQEIAQQLQLPLGTVKSRLHTARKLLQEKMIAKNRVATP
jgi:RNA polymerase sigma-70 factor (ECF subfamily)